MTATHDSSVEWIDIEVEPPEDISATTRVFSSCAAGELAPGPTATRSFVCTLAEEAPNGTWRLTAYATDRDSLGFRGETLAVFEVIGGSDDHRAPVLDSVHISPTPVVIGEPFAVTIRAFDEHHLPPAPTSLRPHIQLPLPPEGIPSWTCTPVAPSVISATLLEWRFTDCVIPAGSSPWTYFGAMTVADALGYRVGLSFPFDAVSGGAA